MDPTKTSSSARKCSSEGEAIELEHAKLQRFGTHQTEPVDFIEYKDSEKFIWFVVLSASIGGLLFGYDTGILANRILDL